MAGIKPDRFLTIQNILLMKTMSRNLLNYVFSNFQDISSAACTRSIIESCYSELACVCISSLKKCKLFYF